MSFAGLRPFSLLLLLFGGPIVCHVTFRYLPIYVLSVCDDCVLSLSPVVKIYSFFAALSLSLCLGSLGVGMPRE